MKYLFIFLLFFLLPHNGFSKGHNHSHRGDPKTEVELMNNVLGCLRYKDSISYYSLFPPFDTLWRMVLHNADRDPETIKQLNQLREHPQSLIVFDPYYNKEIMARFGEVIRKGEDSGIHWNSTVMQRYELFKENMTQDLVGYDKIAPERFQGYIFVRDLLGRSTFCITIKEIQKINGFFYGGQVINILEASTTDEFRDRENTEQKYFAKLAHDAMSDTVKKEDAISDSLKPDDTKITTTATDTDTAAKSDGSLSIAAPADDEKAKTRKEVVDRKYYEGKFDDEIPVKLFVRYMKGPGDGKVAYWDGLYKFGDQVNYVKLNISKNKEGKWIMEDEPPVGTLELELSAKAYTGTWTNNENQTGYDVVLTQTDIPEDKLERLDNILEKGLSGSAGQDTIPEKKKAEKAQEDYFDPNQ